MKYSETKSLPSTATRLLMRMTTAKVMSRKTRTGMSVSGLPSIVGPLSLIVFEANVMHDELRHDD